MYDPSLLLFVAGVLMGIAVAVLAANAGHVLAALRHIRLMLDRSR